MTVADEKQVKKLKEEGVEVWNNWREDNPDVRINLTNADLHGVDLRKANCIGADLWRAYLDKADLSGAILSRAAMDSAILSNAKFIKADLSGAILSRAQLTWANLSKANLSKADLSEAYLSKANLSKADLSGAKLIKANLVGANLSGAHLLRAKLGDANLKSANLSGVDLSGANLFGASLVETNLRGAILTDCKIYGISAWNLELDEKTEQSSLVITRWNEPTVTVDNLEVAQFVYLLLNNEKIRDVLDTIGKKGVLILGRFSPERKQVLNALRDKLRTLDYVPMIFDFKGASTKDFTETVKILAGMCRFIIADITSPKSSPLELQAIVPDYKVPFVPIIQEGEEPFSMFADLQNYPWMFDVLQYKDSDQLIAVIDKAIVQPALIKADELNVQKAEEVRKRHAEDYL